MMKNKKMYLKKEYTPPLLEVVLVEMEEGFAANSANLKPGDINNPDIPDVTDWNDTGSSDKNYDF
ncbi:hypothetical protein BAX94_01175 [Elizabethkingia meningoseptica]|uniref:Uncharacterized protein n=1 Tax=Elizabethkingia meningoseptica TaxID=238 RepID=A0A1T3FHG8_ELIME|nr:MULTISPECIES: hypothetical protein [Elizabethkingia]AQX12729.1 hypothetical protein BBD35_10260 [Elizabethkingia meningoseptica]MBG0514242.1 hypothetical protein [Elizabethkingia meningoseptica]MDE5433158.1 hypothetical protein [Elizabethkingia meningoseptica]MDE5449525.1 hypothetical protein [Elizabethkingia meningoseptica]MDE5471479.1 hypothetical protein [Elizabethkingia meningoseptica]